MPQKGDSFVFSPFKVNRVLWYYSTILKLSECLILIFQLYRICRLKSMKEKKRKIKFILSDCDQKSQQAKTRTELLNSSTF